MSVWGLDAPGHLLDVLFCDLAIQIFFVGETRIHTLQSRKGTGILQTVLYIYIYIY